MERKDISETREYLLREELKYLLRKSGMMQHKTEQHPDIYLKSVLEYVSAFHENAGEYFVDEGEALGLLFSHIESKVINREIEPGTKTKIAMIYGELNGAGDISSVWGHTGEAASGRNVQEKVSV